MLPQKKDPKKQVEKYSFIFLQIGLILVLFVAHTFIEHQTKVEIELAKELGSKYSQEPPLYNFYQIEKEQVKTKKVVQKKQSVVNDLSRIEKTHNTSTLKEALIDLKPLVKNPKKLDIHNLNTMDDTEDIDPDDDPKLYDARIYTPIFKGCEGLTAEGNRICFEAKLKKFVLRKFNSDQGLNSGKYRIYAEFVIDKEGSLTNLKVRASHKSLEKEMKKVLEKLPQLIPGKKGNMPVKVKYLLPLKFEVE